MDYPIGSETTDGRFVKVSDKDIWWDTSGVDLVMGDEVEEYMIENRVGIVVYEKRGLLH